jgi:hypothetical protein
MAKLDRLGWAAELSIQTFGLKIGIRANDPGLLRAIGPHLPPGSKTVSAAVVRKLYSVIGGVLPAPAPIRRMYLLYGNVERLARTAELNDLFESLRSNLNLYVAQNARRRLFIHAGVVGWKDWAVVIPGRSFTGKTTLVQEFLRAGATYYSDEFAVVDRRGFVHPFAAPLGIRNVNTQRQQMHMAEEFGSSIGGRPLRIGCVIATHYRAGARWKPKSVSKGLGALALLANIVAARRNPSGTLAVLSRAVAEAQILKSHRGEAREVVESVLGELDKQPLGLRN